MTELPVYLDPAARLKRNGCEVTILSVDRFGLVDPRQIREVIQPNTVLVSALADSILPAISKS